MTTASSAASAGRLDPAYWSQDDSAERATIPNARTVAAEASPVLEIQSVSLSFGGVTALSDIEMVVAPGEIRAVIGPNGAGKSSLINVISGLYRPDSGCVWLNGESFAEIATDRLARLGVARTFQNLALFKGLSLFDNVAMGLSHTVRAGFLEQIVGSPRARRDLASIQSRTEEVIAFLHLERFVDRLAGTLPYGVQKRVELARALVARPKLLLLDEPMAGMTATEKQEMSIFIRNARDAYGATVVLIEHDIGVVMELSDQVAVLDYGRKIADGAPDAVRADQLVIDAYLGVPHDLEAGEGI